MSETKVNSCPEFPYFGATYPGACCIDGFLWDLDSCDGSYTEEGVLLTQGGGMPCPFCNTEAFITENEDEETTREMLLAHIESLRNRYGKF